MRVTQLARGRQISGRCHLDARLALDGLDQEGGEEIWPRRERRPQRRAGRRTARC